MSAATKDKYTTADGYSYMTKRIVISKAQAAGKKAARAAMDTMGYVVTVQDGWVVRKNEDGSIERIKRL
ncbi:MAG: hypothetical protein EAS52_06105 [Parapedobacter sp.]|nr:MAG: hypothetical protein EAS52_06105 [Parapedobacter sp.]